MFKSLLRTLPSLSGNFTIACKLNEIKKEDNNNFYTYIRMADMMPLQNNIYKNSVELNLLNGKYELDVKKYFNKYSNVFYKTNFNYSKDNCKILDLNSPYNENSDDRNKDYEFGCKRIYYSRTGYQFNFYAPFYLDDMNDLPEYFNIEISIGNNVHKNIKVYINKDNKTNYLKRYLTSYFENVDNKVIFCLPESLQATYFGIDVKKGGLVQYKDNVFGYLYSNQIMINNFDNLICQGFERNNLIMRQIIPLSFMFNLNDLFSEYERNYFNGYKIKIIGYYYTQHDIKLDLFDFDIDYFVSYDKYRKYNPQKAKYEISNGSDGNRLINVMNVGYPALNESKYVEYEFENKISPTYCKFKLMLSDDNDPYITNNSFAYSYLQYPNQKYGYFPTTLKGITPKLICINGDVKLPSGTNINTYYNTTKYFANTVITNNVNYNKFVKLMQNYVSSWFNIYNKSTDMFANDKFWSDVILNYTYHNGILYNLKNLEKYDIDKFSVIMNINMNTVNDDEIVKAKYVYSMSDESAIPTYKFNDDYDMKLYNPLLNLSYYNKFYISNVINNNSVKNWLHYDKLMKKDLYGKYVKINDYEKENRYFKLSQVISIINSYNLPSNIKNRIIEYLNVNKITGYILLDGYNNINYFEKYDDDYKFILTDELFSTNNRNKKYDWLYNKLYYSTQSSSKKIKLSSSYSKLEYNEDISGKFYVYLEDSFIYLYDIYFIINETYESEEEFNNIFDLLASINNIKDSYSYILYNKINDIEVTNYFSKINDSKSKDIYVDSYNLNNLISLSKLKINLNDIDSSEYFISVLNKDHIKEYYFNLNKDENGISQLEFDDGYKNLSILECLYVKERCWFIDSNRIETRDIYTSLHNYLLKSINIDSSNNSVIYEWLYNNISDTRNINNKFEISVGNEKIEVDLCIKKKVFKMNEDIFNFLLYKNNEISNFLYLYIKNDCKNDNKDTWQIIDSTYNGIIKTIDDYLVPLFTDIYVTDKDIESLFNMIQNNKIIDCQYMLDNNSYFKEIDVKETLYKIYEDKSYIIDDLYYKYDKHIDVDLDDKINYLFVNHRSILYNTLLNYFNNFANLHISVIAFINYFTNNIEYDVTPYEMISAISELVHNTSKKNELTKYLLDNNILDEFNNDYIINHEGIDNSLMMIDFLYNIHNNLFYNLVSKNNIELYSIKDTIKISFNHFDNAQYDDTNNINIYNHNGINYGFYLINVDIDNSNYSFNMLNDYNFNIMFDTINGHDISNKTFINSVFHILYPFLKINIFDEFVKNINTIIFPTESEILIKYRTYEYLTEEEILKYRNLITSDEDVLYKELIEYNYHKKIKLLRYFNYITPYLKKIDNTIRNNWSLKFMEPNNEYNDIEKNNILNISDINIYKYSPLVVGNVSYDKNTYQFTDYYEVEQIEHKHFNDNIMYNLPEQIIVYDKENYTQSEIESLSEDKEQLYNKKINILYNYFYEKGLNYDNIKLFLFNKYNSSFFIEKDNNIYKIKYIYSLI